MCFFKDYLTNTFATKMDDALLMHYYGVLCFERGLFFWCKEELKEDERKELALLQLDRALEFFYKVGLYILLREQTL